MDWARRIFVRNARLYELVLEGMWERGEEDALAISSLLQERGMGTTTRILDVPCGTGRVGLPLAQLGYTVAGVDLSPHLVSVASTKARRLGVASRVSFATGSMSDLTAFAEGSFDCAINVFTSIGYGTERDDEAFFGQLRRVVKPGGAFVISGLRNRDYIVNHTAQNVFEESEKLLVLDRYSFDVASSRERGSWRFYLKVGSALKFAGEFPTDIRVYSPHELVSMLDATGWRLAGLYGSLLTRAPFTPASPVCALVAEAV
ncbi:MAG: class I SAM-dependent methyltransferase [Nitrososphaerales archaeon]